MTPDSRHGCPDISPEAWDVAKHLTDSTTMDYFIISNNPMVLDRYPAGQVIPQDSYRHVLLAARDRVHQGARLLSHPQAGSIKPYETLYRSVLISMTQTGLDFDSLQHIENALERFDALAICRRHQDWPQQVLTDFQLIDFSLIETGIKSLGYK